MAAERPQMIRNLHTNTHGEDCAYGEISGMVLAGRVYEPRSARRLLHLHLYWCHSWRRSCARTGRDAARAIIEPSPSFPSCSFQLGYL